MSGFRVNTNVAALSAERSLGTLDRAHTKSMEKLSSGLRINRAADDAAGLAISERFRTQVNGINQGIKNLQDGTSLLQVAEGGISTIGDMVQRIRTLAVQSANDTLTDSDRSLIQTEVDQLLTEVDRQASTVNFNGKTLLTGRYTGVAGAGSVIPAGPVVNQTFDSNGVTQAMARPNYYEDPTLLDPTAVPPQPVPGTSAEFSTGQYTLANAINGTFFGAQTNVAGANETMRFQFQPGVTAANVTSLQFNFVGGSDNNGVSPNNIRYQLYDFQANAWVDVGNNNTGTLLAFTAGTSNAQVVNPSRFFDAGGDVWAQAWVETDNTTTQELDIDYASLNVTTQTPAVNVPGTPGETIQIQAGANKDETIDVTLPDARRAALGLSGLLVSTRANAESAITTATNALTKINGSRAEIGAYQNRLEHSMNFETTQVQNQAAAESRIRDLDYSDEIVEFTKQQVLQQAGVSALAQANVAPQTVLQLLK